MRIVECSHYVEIPSYLEDKVNPSIRKRYESNSFLVIQFSRRVTFQRETCYMVHIHNQRKQVNANEKHTKIKVKRHKIIILVNLIDLNYTFKLYIYLGYIIYAP